MERKWFEEHSGPPIHGLSVLRGDETREHVRDVIQNANDHNETEFSNALLEAIEHERDETFESSESI
ncbi:uncharacterized protein Nmlp_1581 [Natronomonas moolapensis 8.8.11]|uniref:Uncharacterized protein n=1 Tax=Natronomonas moolapensis (strain DSM 18674 / CECT 7526 / JCM 14361 / 8.8.11) TaxID=268739 RepID=M1XP52_NATM8|nr:uncharacterized protein Nmlp_1581 [Natronomonas moolapensis 8.8.11]